MSQSRRGSALEACLNTLVGFLVSLGVTYILSRLVGLELPGDEVVYAVTFTLVSVVRNFLIRRYGQHRIK